MPYRKTKPIEPPLIRRNGLTHDISKRGEVLAEAKAVKAKKPKEAKVKRVCNPQLVAAARELRDRWLEQVNAGTGFIASVGKYDVTRAIGGGAECTAAKSLIAA